MGGEVKLALPPESIQDQKAAFNNMVQDPPMVHEATPYHAFHAMGVPAPHVGYTYLTVNGKSYGLHLNLETQDAQSLEKYFGVPFADPQHLYEGEYAACGRTSSRRAARGSRRSPRCRSASRTLRKRRP